MRILRNISVHPDEILFVLYVFCSPRYAVSTDRRRCRFAPMPPPPVPQPRRRCVSALKTTTGYGIFPVFGNHNRPVTIRSKTLWNKILCCVAAVVSPVFSDLIISGSLTS